MSESQSCMHQVTMEDQITEDPNVVRTDSLLGFPNATNYLDVSSPSFEFPMNDFHDIWDDLGDENDILIARKKPKTYATLDDDILKNYFHESPSNDINNSVNEEQRMHIQENFQVQTVQTAETDLEQGTRASSQNIPNDQTSKIDHLNANPNEELNMLRQVVLNVSPTFTAGEGSSTELLEAFTSRSEKGTMGPVPSSGNLSTSTFSSSQNPSSIVPARNDPGPIQQAWHSQHGMSSTLDGFTISEPQDPPRSHDGALFGSSLIPHGVENSPMQYQTHSAPIIPVLHDATSQYARGSIVNFSGQPMRQHFLLNTTSVGPSTWVPPMLGMVPTSYPRQLLPTPSIFDLRDYVKTWEGSLAGKFQPNRVSIIKAKAFMKATSPLAHTLEVSSRLKISLFFSEKVINHTKSISSGPIDYMFFNTLSKSNKLYEHLLRKKLCAKIDFSYQSLILSTTEKENFFLGSVFPGETIFVEPL